MHLYLKLLHIAAVIVFLGNIFTGLFWMHLAVRTKDIRIIHHTIKGVIKSDRWFTLPGVMVIIMMGVFAAMSGNFPLIRTGWIFWSIVLFSVSGIAFMARVAPLQKKMATLTEGDHHERFDWDGFNKVFRSWDLWGLVALITPIAALVMMVLKKPA